MEAQNLYDEKVREIILSQKEYPVALISNLRCVYSGLFTQESYLSLLELIKQAKFDELPNPKNKEEKDFYEYLSVYNFRNEESTELIVTIYDSDELWQDPQFIDIFPL